MTASGHYSTKRFAASTPREITNARCRSPRNKNRRLWIVASRQSAKSPPFRSPPGNARSPATRISRDSQPHAYPGIAPNNTSPRACFLPTSPTTTHYLESSIALLLHVRMMSTEKLIEGLLEHNITRLKFTKRLVSRSQVTKPKRRKRCTIYL